MPSKSWIFILVAILSPIIIYAQSLTSQEWEKIKDNPEYLIGMGHDMSLENARQGALNSLISQISLKVSSQFNHVATNDVKGNEVSSNEKTDMIIKSYGAASLNNVSEYIEHANSGEYTVYRYMKRSEMHAMFKRRISMSKKWAEEGFRCESEGKIGDALQNYYWSLALLRSCPDGDMETIYHKGGDHNIMQYLFSRVKDILTNIDIEAISVEKEDNDKQNVTLAFNYNNDPMVNFNYRFNDGKEVSDVYTVKDGVGELSLPLSYKLNKLKLQAEYECREEANIHPDLLSVMETTDPVPFSSAIIKVETKNCRQSSEITSLIVDNANPGKNVTIELSNAGNSNIASTSGAGDFLSTMETVKQGLAKRNYSTLESCFTEQGWDMFNKLIKYGEARLLKDVPVDLKPDNDGMVCRSFPMSFLFKGTRRTFTEDVVFYMDANAKINEVAFGLEKAAIDDIMRRSDWGDDARRIMVHFLETYKTAYALKRLDYINTIFSNEALIITGSVLQPTGKKESVPSSKKHVKYTRQTKAEYMENLRKCFGSNEYINIRFADNIVRRSHTNPNIYGIQIKQDYFSSTYGDTGYLFLMIDFADTSAPLIHVRTWQPDLDPNVKDGRIGMADFML